MRRETPLSKSLMVLAWGLMAIALMIALTVPTAMGYELFIYAPFPPVFWGMVLVATILGYCLAASQVFHPNGRRTYHQAMGIVTFANLILLLLPSERGYYFFGRHDPLTQVGMIIDIQLTGHIGKSNFYPLLHVLAYSGAIATGTSPEQVRSWLPIIFFFGFQAWTYLLVRGITKSIGAARLALLLASVPVYPILTTFTPSDSFFLFVPFVLYLYVLTKRQRSLKTQLLFVPTLLVAPFSHPEVVLFLALFFVAHDVASALERRRPKEDKLDNFYSVSSFGAFLILLAAFFLWFSTFAVFGASLSRIRESLLGETLEPAPIQLYQSLFARSGFSILTLLWVVFILAGPRIVYVMMALGAFFYISRKRGLDASTIALGIPVLTLMPITALTLVTDTIIGYERVLKYLVFAATILVCTCVAKFATVQSVTSNRIPFPKEARENQGLDTPRTSVAFIGGCILVAACVAPFSLYSSPFVYYPNDQATSTDFAGAFWLAEHGNERINVTDVLVLGRYVHALFGYDESLRRFPQFALSLYQTQRLPPPNLNYDSPAIKGKTSILGTYLLIDAYTKSLYCELFPEQGRIRCSDFRALERYPGASKIYTNGGFEVWYVRPLA